MNIIFNPPVNEENQYIQLLVGELRARGYTVHPLDDFFSSRKHFKSIRLVHLNWFENIDDSSFFVALRSFFRKLFVLTVIRLSGKPLVWTMHNRTSHEQGLAFFGRTLTKLLVRWSHRIVIHTRQSEVLLAAYGKRISAKTVYIPHPNFIGVYGDVLPPKREETGTLSLLFTGMVKPYKNLELLIDVVGIFGSAVQLTIAGKALNKHYQQQLADHASRVGNVKFIPYFVPDSELAALIAGADALVLPYDITSSLNSGTVLLAFSYKKTVVCPAIGTLSDLGEQLKDVFFYQYHTPEEHRVALTEQVKRAMEIKQREPHALEAMGERLHTFVADEYNPHRIGEQLAKLYRELIGGAA